MSELPHSVTPGINTNELVPAVKTDHEVAAPVRSPGETLGNIASTLLDLRDRITALPPDLPDDPNSSLNMRVFDGDRGVSISLTKKVVAIGGDGSQKLAEHFYGGQVRSEAEDRSKPFVYREGDPFSVSFSAETDTRDHLGLQFRGAGSTGGPKGPSLRAMDGATEMKVDKVQSGIDAILSELSDAVGQREELARSLGLIAEEQSSQGPIPDTSETGGGPVLVRIDETGGHYSDGSSIVNTLPGATQDAPRQQLKFPILLPGYEGSHVSLDTPVVTHDVHTSSHAVTQLQAPSNRG